MASFPILSLRRRFQDLEQTFAMLNQVNVAVTQQVKARSLGQFAAVVKQNAYSPGFLILTGLKRNAKIS
ncbi:MAG: hypothetical protein QNJ46_19635 [Leptolyngbyaceae cyanobacterium MO_188.B28]|nr:hypothetical protein [Leptolyngbyaceae cyanobacterium MO_188.B28]